MGYFSLGYAHKVWFMASKRRSKSNKKGHAVNIWP